MSSVTCENLPSTRTFSFIAFLNPFLSIICTRLLSGKMAADTRFGANARDRARSCGNIVLNVCPRRRCRVVGEKEVVAVEPTLYTNGPCAQKYVSPSQPDDLVAAFLTTTTTTLPTDLHPGNLSGDFPRIMFRWTTCVKPRARTLSSESDGCDASVLIVQERKEYVSWST